jgi:arginine exporter protein ArgO
MPLGFFNIKFFNKNYKHYHIAIIITCFLVGLIFLILGVDLISYSEIYVLSSFVLSCVFFGFGFYYVIDMKRKKPSNKEIKTHTNST